MRAKFLYRDKYLEWVSGWISRGRGWGNSRGNDGEGENAPRELCPSSLPPNPGPLHIFLAGAQPFPFNTGGTAPPREGVQGPWECLATVEDLGGGRGPRKGAAVSFSSEEGAYELDLPHTPPRPRYPRKWQSSPVFLPGKSHEQRSLASYSLWGRRESDTTERLN